MRVGALPGELAGLTQPGSTIARADDVKVLWVAESLDRASAEWIVGIHRSGIDIDVITGPECPMLSYMKDCGLSVTALRIRQRLDVAAIRKLRERLERKRYHVLHAHGNAALGCGIQATRGTKIGITCFRGYMRNVRIWYPPSWLTYLHPRVSRIICGSKAVARFFHELKVKIPPEKIVTIYKGHELDWYRDPPTDLTTLGVPEDAFTVGFCGRNRMRKGIHVLIETALHLPPDLPVHYVLAGKLERNRTLDRLIAESPARERIHRLGFRTDAPQIAGACDVFVMPSIDREGFSRAVIEAMAYATPPIVSDAGGMPEQVEHGVSGLVVPQSDPRALAAAILDLYEHPEKRAELGRRARQRVAEVFTCRRTVRESIALYRELRAELWG